VSYLPDDGLKKKAETCSSLEIKINNQKTCVTLNGHYNTALAVKGYQNIKVLYLVFLLSGRSL
jgi:hypothetical protein